MKLLKVVLFFTITSQLHSQICFNNPDEAATYALKKSQNYSLNLNYAEYSLKAANLAIQEFLPTFDFSISEDDSISMNSSDSRNKSVSININQTLFDGGKRIIAYKMNKTEKYFALKSAEQNIDQFRLTVISQYYTCLLQDTLVKIKSELEKNTKTQLDIIKKEFELGLVLENDYLEYLISYKKILDEKRQAERKKRAEYRLFKVLLGINPETEIYLEPIQQNSNEITCYLEPYIERLWYMTKTNSIAIKKNEISLYYTKQQYKYSRRFYIPEIKFQGGISFSGTEYPLNDPQYSAKFSISFNNIPFMPISLSNSYGFKDSKLKSLNNAVGGSVNISPDYFYGRDAAKISLQQQIQTNKDEMNSLYENLFNQISAFDDNLDSISRLEETIELQQKRITISEKQVEKGELKRIDYLNQLISLSEQQIQLEQSKISNISMIRNLEILLCIPFGELKECISK